jgi:hypothetical protein
MSTAGQQVKFMNMLLDECMLHSNEERKIAWLYNDNIGGLFLANNKQVSMRTKHIDIRALFIRELKEKQILDIFYEKSENLLPDLLSKNLALRLFDRHQRSLQYGKMITWREDVGDDRQRRLGFVQGDHEERDRGRKMSEGSPGAQTRAQTRHTSTVIEMLSNDMSIRCPHKIDSSSTDRGQKDVGNPRKDARVPERTKRHTNRPKADYSNSKVNIG